MSPAPRASVRPGANQCAALERATSGHTAQCLRRLRCPRCCYANRQRLRRSGEGGANRRNRASVSCSRDSRICTCLKSSGDLRGRLVIFYNQQLVNKAATILDDTVLLQSKPASSAALAGALQDNLALLSNGNTWCEF